MDEGAQIAIQGGPNGIHEKLKAIGTPSGAPLCKIELPDGSLLVPPGQPQPNLDAATHALRTISDVLTGDETTSPDDAKYIYKSTSPNVARVLSVAAPARKLRRLRAKQGVAFELECSKGLRFTHLTGVDSAFSLNGGLSDFFGAVGDFFTNVANGIYDVVKIVVTAVGDAYEMAVTFVVDGLTKTFNGLIRFVEEAAALAAFVFDAIKTGIERVIQWLKFIFDLRSIKRTARHFNGWLGEVGNDLTVSSTECEMTIERLIMWTIRHSSTW